MYNPNHHYYYLNADMGRPSKQEQNISKSIDQLYSVPSGGGGEIRKGPGALVDDYRELPVSFQPVNFTQMRGGNQQLPNSSFKRDSVAEKKRASIGKFPQNLNVSLLRCFVLF